MKDSETVLKDTEVSTKAIDPRGYTWCGMSMKWIEEEERRKAKRTGKTGKTEKIRERTKNEKEAFGVFLADWQAWNGPKAYCSEACREKRRHEPGVGEIQESSETPRNGKV
jgi:hypothetical protein